MPAIQNVEIFASGTWNGMKFVNSDLDEIVSNTNELIKRGRVKPPLKLGHSDTQILKGQDDGDPALGWIDNLTVKDGKILADFNQIPDVLFKAIDQGLWKQVSVEMKHIDHRGFVLTAVALLGADIPAVKTLDDLTAFLSEAHIAQQQLNTGSALQFSIAEPNIFETPKKGNIMPEDNAIKVDVKVDEGLTAALAENKTMSDENKLMKEKIEKFEASEKKIKFNEEKVKHLSQFQEDVKSGSLPPAILDKIENHFDEQEVSFSDHEKLSINSELMREVAGAYKESLPKGEQAGEKGKSETRADKALEIAIAKCMSESGKSYQEANTLVFNAQPELWEDYQKLTVKFSDGTI